MARGETIAGLDIGTTKTCAVVAATGPEGLEILGVGEAPSTGMRKGVVTDLEETVRAIEAATEKAERMAGVHVSHVYVGVTGEHIQSTNNRGVVAVTGDDREVMGADVRRVVDVSKIINLAADRQIIHALPRQFTVDGQDGVSDPVGMAGGRLEVDTHIVTGGSTFITNVLKCVHRAGLEPAGIVFEPLASSAATLLPEEKQVGVVLLDIGGGTTDIAVYAGGGVVHTATIPVGGNILTNDIALGLKTTFAEAEHVKRTYGSGVQRTDDVEQTFQVKSLDGRSTREVTTSQLRAIVLPRVLEIFRLAKANVVDRIPRDQVLGEVVITGGGAHLRGIEATAADVFGLPVRIGVPSTIAGLTDAVKQPQYATAVGLVLFGPRGETAPHLNGSGGGPFAKLWSWFTSIWN
ncbi:MAG TPA: cell division protein FtsA [Candidatus Acidoferrum sp.]|nr:cell division protein FtsA [Candidatus Acidoferrum sp.]